MKKYLWVDGTVRSTPQPEGFERQYFSGCRSGICHATRHGIFTRGGGAVRQQQAQAVPVEVGINVTSEFEKITAKR